MKIYIILLSLTFLSGCATVTAKDEGKYVYSVPIDNIDGCSATFNHQSNQYIDIITFPHGKEWEERFLSHVSALSQNLTARGRGKRIGIFFMDDISSPNAMAINPGFYNEQDYAVLFGKRMYSKSLIINREEILDGGGDYSLYVNDIYIASILAHEFAHVGQYITHTGLSGRTVNRELMADVISGWYIGMMVTNGGSQPLVDNQAIKDINETINRTFRSGDYQFNHKDHHGTPDQRAEAFIFGLDLVRNGGVRDFWDAFDVAANQYMY